MTRFLPLAALAAALLLPSTAGAAMVTIGSTTPDQFATPADQSNSLTVVQTGSPSGGTSYTVPDGNWLVRAVSARVATDQSTSVSMQYARPTATADHYVFQGSDPIEVPVNSPGQVFSSLGLSRKVQGGDRLGISVYNGNSFYSSMAPGYAYTFDAGLGNTGPVAGDDTTLTPHDDGYQIAISAVLESDTDGDGYGDDSDDKCKFDAERHEAPCATDDALTFSVTPTTVQGGQDVTSTTVITNKGPEQATNIVIHIPYGQRFFHGSFPPECENRQAETQCNLPSLDAGMSHTIVGKITSISPNTPPEKGSPVTEGLSAYTESSNRDLDKSNNNPPAIGMTVLPIPVAATPDGTKCFVAKLKGLSRAQAKSALKAGHCNLGKVKKPKKKLRKHHKLVVSKQSLKAGSQAAAGTKVSIKLKSVKK